jgi:tight adherence protein B
MRNRRDLLVAFAVASLSALIFSILQFRSSFIAGLSFIAFVLTVALLTHIGKSRERKAFEMAFPEAVEMLTRSVKTGVPLDEAFLSLAERFEGELSRRFDIFQSELALGKPFRDAGVTFCDGLNMPDVEFFFAVLSLNRESGSELTPTLEAMSYTLRERQKIRRRAVVLTSEIRSSAKVMAALPFFVAAIMFFLNPGMTDFYLHDLTGQVILGCCVLSILFGLMIIRDIANIDD